MIDDLRDIDERLAGLARATSTIEPTPGFHARVMDAVNLSAKRDWRVGVWRVGRYGLVLAAVALVLATMVAARGQSQDDQIAASAYGTVDLEW